MFDLDQPGLTPPDLQQPVFEANKDLVKFTRLDEIDLDEELAKQFSTVKNLLTLYAADKLIPLNQKAQAANTMTSVLQQIIKMRTELYSAERIRKIEGILLEVLKQFPTLQAPFMTMYEQELEKAFSEETDG